MSAAAEAPMLATHGAGFDRAALKDQLWQAINAAPMAKPRPANVLEITGVELDYDQEQIPFDEAVEVCKRGKLYALVYTSPSHSPEKPRWRILLPTSLALPPGERYKLAARVGLFGGVFAGESFVVSQAFYLGSVNGNPAHQVVIVEGDDIDLRTPRNERAPGDEIQGARLSDDSGGEPEARAGGVTTLQPTQGWAGSYSSHARASRLAGSDRA